MNNVLVIILTHGRADNVVTVKSLKRHGYTGEIVFLVDNEDDQIELYKKNFGPDNVEVFDKKWYADQIDELDNFDKRITITHARNASYDIAKKRGYRYFIQLDDDYTRFEYRFNHRFEYVCKTIEDFDSILEIMKNFLIESGAKVIAMSQAGDFIGGKKGGFGTEVRTKRKAMNSFLCDVENRLWFFSRLNEDVTTYVWNGNKGVLFLTFNNTSLNQKATQSNKGGITEAYLESGTYVKSFYTVMVQPSSVQIGLMGDRNPRLHHKINWKYTVPCILDEKHKK